MNTLLFRLAGPMQSWGVQSRFGMRDTGLEPSKSGVIGLLCAALGCPRTDTATVEKLARLRMGVRVDCEGKLEKDYHTAQKVYKAGGGIKGTELSNRYYLAGAVFLAGFESDDLQLLNKLCEALKDPVWSLYLGRKAFIPSPPIYLPDGLKENAGLLDALERYGWLGSDGGRYRRLKDANPHGLRLVLDDAHGEQVRPDLPVSFSERRFAPRRVATKWVAWPQFRPDQEVS